MPSPRIAAAVAVVKAAAAAATVLVVGLGSAGCASRPADGGRTAAPLVETSSAVGLDCGTERLSYDDRQPVEPRQCFVEAVAQRQVATFVSIAPTTEGDPIFMTLTGDPTGLVTVVVDASQDMFRGHGPALTTYTCASIDGDTGGSPDEPDFLLDNLHGCTSPSPR